VTDRASIAARPASSKRPLRQHLHTVGDETLRIESDAAANTVRGGNAESSSTWLAYHAALVRRAIREASHHHVTSVAAALAYYAFLTIPSALLVAVGLFGLLASPDTVNALVDRLSEVMPGEATDLVSGSLNRVTREYATVRA
jgi:Virulence factor BrkB